MSAPLAMVVLVLAVARPPAPGTADDAALDRWRLTAPWKTSAAVGVARPWGPLDVRTDWLDGRVTARGIAVSVGAARTTTATVQQRATWIGFELRARSLGLRTEVVRRVIGVDGHPDDATVATAVGARWSSAVGTLGAGFAVPTESTARVRSSVTWETRVGALDLVVRRADRRHDRATDVVVAARLDVASSLGTGLRVEAHDTLWSVDLAGAGWTLAVGRVVQGPREGASAIRLEWAP